MVENLTRNDLRKVLALEGMPDTLLDWLMEKGTYAGYKEGDIIVSFGQHIPELILLVEGKIDFYMDVNGRKVYYFTFANTPETGGATGLLPYSRMKGAPGYSYAMSDIKGVRLHKDHFPEMEQKFPDFVQRLVGYMTERARSFATTKLQHEKVNALGKLAAGVAHELNNPAAAINRISADLAERLRQNYKLTECILKQGVMPGQVQAIRNLVESREKENREKLSASRRIELEDEIMGWLDDNSLGKSIKSVDTFVDSGFLIPDLELIRKDSGDKAFEEVLQWLENLLASERLMKDLHIASERISKLVGAIKSHVHMDRSTDVQCCTDIHNDIENTLTLLGYKIREKNMRVNREFAEGLPQVEAYIGELNQVWTNIIDNAVFAVAQDGQLTISTSTDGKNVNVKFTDNGSGIPQDIISRVFDPFFTTKKVGQGTGIGLDLTRRIIERHNGEIRVSSAPGKTEFDICLPIKHSQTKPNI